MSNSRTIPQTQTPSIRCSICRIAIFGEAHATKHATLTQHCEFEEYVPEPGEEVAQDTSETGPILTDEEKLAKIEELRKRNLVIREQKKSRPRKRRI